MKVTFEFNTRANATKFMKTLRRAFILTERKSDLTVKIWNFEGVKDERKEYARDICK